MNKLKTKIIHIEGLINEFDDLDDEAALNSWSTPTQLVSSLPPTPGRQCPVPSDESPTSSTTTTTTTTATTTASSSATSFTQSQSSLSSSSQTTLSFNLFDSEMNKNLAQIDSLIQITREHIFASPQPNNAEAEQLEQISKRLGNLKDLFDEYKKAASKLSKNNENYDELRFLQYLILRRMNTINELFGLNKSFNITSLLQSPTTTTTTTTTNSVMATSNSVMAIKNDLDKYEHLIQQQQQQQQQQQNNSPLKKLRVTNIRLDQSELDEATTDEFQCVVYQFDNSLNQLDVRKYLATEAQLNSKITKRSSSADHSTSTLKRRFRLKYDEFNNNNNKQNKYADLTYLNQANNNNNDTIDNRLQLSEKCISHNSFKFKRTSIFNEVIDLNASCTHLTFLIYKLTNPVDNFKFRMPIKYLTLTLNEANNLPFDLIVKTPKNSSQTSPFLFSEQYLYETHKVALSALEPLQTPAVISASSSGTIDSTSSTASLSSTSNVFKRMFKKSKSQSRTSSTNGGGGGARLRDVSITKKFKTLSESKQQENVSFICVDLSTSVSEQLAYRYKVLSLDKLELWREMWRPCLDADLNFYFEQPLTENAANFDLLNIYFDRLDYFAPSQFNEHRSKLAQHQMNKQKQQNSANNFNNCLFFVQVSFDDDEATTMVHSYRTCLFKLNSKINELCQLRVDLDSGEKKRVGIELFKLESGKVGSVSSGFFDVNRKLTSVFDLNMSPNESSVSLSLKLKFGFVREVLPCRRTSSDLFEFAVAENGLSVERERELLSVVEAYLRTAGFGEVILIRKFIELFYVLNYAPGDENLTSPGSPLVGAATRRNEITSSRKVIRRVLHTKIYEAFVRVLNECFSSGRKISYSTLLKNLKGSSLRPASQFLLSFIKNLPDTDADLFNLTIKSFPALIDLIISLSTNTKSKYELKYEINDLILKLFTGKHVDHQRRLFICTHLNFSFFNSLVDLFTPFELSTLLAGKFLPEPSPSTHSALVQMINNNQLFQLHPFNQNYQFRDYLVTYLIKTYLNIDKLKTIERPDLLALIQNLLNHKTKLSRTNLDSLTGATLRFLIETMCEKILDPNQSNALDLFPVFLSLIELIDLTMPNKASLDILTNESHLHSLFHIFTVYFLDPEKITPQKYQDARKLNHHINSTILKFSKYIQKILNRLLIMKCDDEALLESLTRGYFEFLFSILNRPTVSISLTTKFKLEILHVLTAFWRTLNFKLKRTLSLTDLVLSRLSECLMHNFYFKLVKLEGSSVCFNQLADLARSKNGNFLILFYESCFKLMHEVSGVNQIEAESLRDILILNCMSFVLKNERVKRTLKRKSNQSNEPILNGPKLKNFSYQISHLLNECLTFNLSQQLKLIVEYNLVKEDEEDDDEGEDDVFNHLPNDSQFKISIVEKFLLIYNLYKQIDRLDLNRNKVYNNNNNNSLNDLKRKIQMNLLDDLYHLHKVEKNYLQMSFVRKEQADLLEWNLSKKSESDLKEILYLKSLKKFAINSLQEKLLNNDASIYVSNSSVNDCSSSSTTTSTFSSTTSITAPSSSTSSSSSPSTTPTTPQSSTTNTTNAKLLDVTHHHHHHNNNNPNITQLSCDQNFFTSIQFEICKQLCAYYEKLDENYSKFTRLLSAESKLANANHLNTKLSQTNDALKHNNLHQHGHLYFRVGFFGSCLKLNSIRNKYFLYKHYSYDMVSNVQSLILNKLMYDCKSGENDVVNETVLLHHNQEPDAGLKESREKCYLQVCAVNRLEKPKLLELIDEMNESKETVEIREYVSKCDDSACFYYFDRPFYTRIFHDDDDEEEEDNADVSLDVEFSEGVENLWLERNILITDEYATKYENLTQFEQIKAIYKILMNPIRNAINDINEKSREMKNFVLQFTASNSSLNYALNLNVIHSLQPLTMRLLGCLDARVNGGLIKYVRELLNNESLFEAKLNEKRATLFFQLYVSIKEQLAVLENGLSIHDRILKEIELKLKELKLDESDLDVKQLKNFEHVKHMSQLNVHLIECFKMIEHELNEKWRKFSLGET